VRVGQYTDAILREIVFPHCSDVMDGTTRLPCAPMYVEGAREMIFTKKVERAIRVGREGEISWRCESVCPSFWTNESTPLINYSRKYINIQSSRCTFINEEIHYDRYFSKTLLPHGHSRLLHLYFYFVLTTLYNATYGIG
jgi:hypothetical protein